MDKYFNFTQDLNKKFTCLLWESNPGPSVYKTDALPLSQEGI
jgi:hypothetical protein